MWERGYLYLHNSTFGDDAMPSPTLDATQMCVLLNVGGRCIGK